MTFVEASNHEIPAYEYEGCRLKAVAAYSDGPAYIRGIAQDRYPWRKYGERIRGAAQAFIAGGGLSA